MRSDPDDDRRDNRAADLQLREERLLLRLLQPRRVSESVMWVIDVLNCSKYIHHQGVAVYI